MARIHKDGLALIKAPSPHAQRTARAVYVAEVLMAIPAEFGIIGDGRAVPHEQVRVRGIVYRRRLALAETRMRLVALRALAALILSGLGVQIVVIRPAIVGVYRPVNTGAVPRVIRRIAVGSPSAVLRVRERAACGKGVCWKTEEKKEGD